MKNIYVILAFHAHELLWDLPNILLSYLDENNPMKDSLKTTNYLKERNEEGRDIYTLSTEFGERLQAPLCIEYTNELLIQLKKISPEVFEELKESYQKKRIYPLYGHAHHAHVSLLNKKEIIQEISWNKEFLHNEMEVPYPKYQGLFPPEDSLNYNKLSSIVEANIDYVIFPHLEKEKLSFEVKGEGDYKYKPFLIGDEEKHGKKIIAFPRNFPISQEIWRPITKMKRDELKSQGYILGEYPVFGNEYYGDEEEYPVDMKTGVEMYVEVLRQELEKVPENGVLVYIQDLELMNFGDIALDIIEKSWNIICDEDKEKYNINFVTPDQYIDEVLSDMDIKNLPQIRFDKISWAPEIRLILRTDGHYPPLGVNKLEKYSRDKTGIYDNPHVFWENGKYFCDIFDTLLNNFNIFPEIPVDTGKLGEKDYDLKQESLNSQIVLYQRIIKRACNWGWRPTEGRQKRPCLLGYLLASTLLKVLEEYPSDMILKQDYKKLDPKSIVGLSETLKVFIDGRINYLKYGLEEYQKSHDKELNQVYSLFNETESWKNKSLQAVQNIYYLNQQGISSLNSLLIKIQDYCQAVYLATNTIQKIWGESPDPEFLVEKMYKYLYDLYPPVFPSMLEKIDNMTEKEIEKYFKNLIN